MSDHADQSERVTIRVLRRWVREGRPIPMLTCYDATTAKWLWRGGVRCLLVGDTAAQVILGHDTTLPVGVGFMVELTAAVRRGAPDAFVMADMPFGSYQCGDDEAVRNAVRFLTDGGADVVKLEVGASHLGLVARLAEAGVPVVAHIGSRPQQVRLRGGYGSTGRSVAEMEELVRTSQAMIEHGASMLLIEAVPAEVSQRVVAEAGADVPVIGCGAGPTCHGHVVVLHDLLGLTDWQPPFAKPHDELGGRIETAAQGWVKAVVEGEYLKDAHPYKMEG